MLSSHVGSPSDGLHAFATIGIPRIKRRILSANNTASRDVLVSWPIVCCLTYWHSSLVPTLFKPAVLTHILSKPVTVAPPLGFVVSTIAGLILVAHTLLS